MKTNIIIEIPLISSEIKNISSITLDISPKNEEEQLEKAQEFAQFLYDYSQTQFYIRLFEQMKKLSSDEEE